MTRLADHSTCACSAAKWTKVIIENWDSAGNCSLTFPFLTLYTTDPTAQKFSDDSAVVGCITGREESEYDSAVDNFVTWRNLYKTIGGGLKEDHKCSLEVKKCEQLYAGC